MSKQWKERNRPVRLERRYDFDSYDELRDFLDQAAELSEQKDLFPDMGFGRDYVNMTIHADEGAEEVSAGQREFAQQLDDIGGYRATS